MIKMWTYEEFEKISFASQLRDYYKDRTLGFKQLWKNGIPPNTNAEMYEQYKKWHSKNYSKLGQALK